MQSTLKAEIITLLVASLLIMTIAVMGYLPEISQGTAMTAVILSLSVWAGLEIGHKIQTRMIEKKADDR